MATYLNPQLWKTSNDRKTDKGGENEEEASSLAKMRNIRSRRKRKRKRLQLRNSDESVPCVSC
jgi:hypothetical protein